MMEFLAGVGVWVWPGLTLVSLLITVKLFNHDKDIALLQQQAETNEKHQDERHEELMSRLDTYQQVITNVIADRHIS